jgi:hypothetical protein
VNMQVEQVIYSIVEFARCFVQGQEDALLLRLDVRYSHYTDEKEFGASTIVDIVLRFPYGTGGSVNVFYYEHDERGWTFVESLPWGKFDNISNHDSCWRDALSTKLHRLHFRLTNEVIAQVGPAEGVKLIPKHVDSFHHFHSIEQIKVKLVPAERGQGRSEGYKIESASRKEA